ncbi:MAG: respiratory nitrate reductase subunit gamma [Alphaproteobacteria bacterium]|jgi:nitrate reductase gamma subunit|nr:respiratory nitrate reductase subunit gamma [Alphaproteobacteria bacterium]
MLTTAFAVLFYAAGLVLILGLARKVRQYAAVPAPLKIPTTPAPTSRGGVVLRLLREVVFFESLFRANKWTWVFGWLFHAALLLAFFRHLRYAIEPVWQWVVWIQPFGKYAAFALVVGLAGLWVRRLVVDRVRYVTGPSDHLMLALLAGIVTSGIGLRFVARTDIVALKAFVLGLLRFDWQPLPSDPLLLIHLALVVVLMLVLPFSKLLHAPGLFFSPSRNQVDDPRERRHLSPWARELERKEGGA